MLLDPAHVVDRVVDVVEEDLADAGAPLGKLTAPVDEPAVVGADPGEPVLVRLGVGCGAKRTKLGKNGGTVFGKITSPTTWSRSWSPLRFSLSQLRMRSSLARRSLYGFLYRLRHASKSSRYSLARYSRYTAWLAPAWQSAEMIG